MREKGRRKKGRTWAEAARTVLEKNPNTPMSHKEILQVIQKEGLKEIRSGTSPLACLNAMLHTNSRGNEGIFYKVPGRMGVYTLKKDVPDGQKDLSDGSEESSDVQSDSPTSENGSSSSSSDRSSNKEGRKSRWRRKVSTRLSQVSSPQSGCPSPSIPPSKVISSSQKHSKKALKQALKQKQRKQQQCRASGPVSSNHHLLQQQQQQQQQQHAKTSSHSALAKPVWEGKQSDGHSSSPQNSTSSSSPSVRAEPSLPVLGKKPFQRSDRLHARQLKRTKCAEIDVETPDSILVNTNLRALINKHTFSVLPVSCQQRLLLLLPEVDRQAGVDGLMKLNSSALNNEFFTSAAQGWKERLSEGEFTPEIQLRLRQEREKEKKVELWKEHFFESYYGQSSGLSPEESKQLTSCTTIAQALTRSPTAQLEKCLPVSVAAPGEDDVSDPLVDLKPQDLLVQPAAGKGKDEHQPQAPKLAEFGSDSPSKFSNPTLHRAAKATEEATYVELGGERPHTVCLESAGNENGSKPKSPTSVGVGSCQGGESQEQVAKEAPSPSMEEMDTGVQGLKRKSQSPEEALTMPEKRPHVSENCSSGSSFQSMSQPFPAAPVPKVPPLRIPVSRIHGSPLPFPSSQVSPRPSFPCSITSPRRTGARTLADIKARAQMARAQRAAAAAEAAAAASLAATAASIAGAIPGPGPGGGRGEKSDPASGRPPGTSLDLADPGSGTDPRKPLPPRPDAWSPAEPAVSGSDSRAQLQSTPSVQPGRTGSNSVPETPLGPQPVVGSSSPLIVPAVQGAKASLDMSAGLVGIAGEPAVARPTLSQAPRTACDPRPITSNTNILEAAPASSTAPTLLPVCQVPSGSCKAHPPSSSQVGTVVTSAVPPPSCRGPPVAHSLKVVPPSSLAANSPPVKTSSSIPANNPLVTQLLQGKEVPMEQILPRPLLVRTDTQQSGKEGKEPGTPTRETSERHPYLITLQLSSPPSCGSPGLSQSRQQILRGPQPLPGQNLWSATASPYPSQETLGKTAREHLLQALRQRVPTAVVLPPERTLPPPGFPQESNSTSQSFMLGFTGRRTSKPAMSGHYLLNVSTYGRGPDNLRRNLAMHPERSLCLDGPRMEFEEQEQVSGDSSSGEEGGDDGTEDEEASLVIKEEPLTCKVGGGQQLTPEMSALKLEQASIRQKEEGSCRFSAGSAVARDFIQGAEEKVAQAVRGEGRPTSVGLPSVVAPTESSLPRPLLLAPSQRSQFFGNPGPGPLLGSGYSGTINVSTSPDVHQEALLTRLSDPSSMGDVVSFSVTVTTIPTGQSVNANSHGQPLPSQPFSEEGSLEDLPSKCYCRLKAMIMCKGCGAFCHDDCIGPSKLCVSCLVVR
ncbi:putative Polycomb group protein ASXL2 [Tiliqua scincoides]|uniref:putative Polycomb group protein ASXL2 n=1 Tax=Tiliqua scincoides TaxID=71010 RepID=UPI003462DB37